MSLRTLYLDELNALAKRQDEGFAAKLREVMVNRHPATLDPDEHDPVDTVALAWKEVDPRGRAAFEAFAWETIDRMEHARVAGDADACDWPLAHATCRLLGKVPAEIIDASLREKITRRLAGLVADREDFVALVGPAHPAPRELWTDAFRIYVAWGDQQTGSLENPSNEHP
ncbi:MAG: hypothetical protein JJT96_15685 [Opitutales bacterium]|nr:hypothetical protein [Opitutales bacterium]